MEEISVIKEEPKLVVGLRRIGHYKDISVMLPQLFGYAFSHNARIAGPPMYLWHEKSVEDAERADREGNAYIEICIPIAERIPETAEIKCYEIPGGGMAKITHKGPYEDCGPVYERLFAWIEKNGKMLSGPIREAYLNDPREVGPEGILTVIYAPID